MEGNKEMGKPKVEAYNPKMGELVVVDRYLGGETMISKDLCFVAELGEKNSTVLCRLARISESENYPVDLKVTSYVDRNVAVSESSNSGSLLTEEKHRASDFDLSWFAKAIVKISDSEKKKNFRSLCGNKEGENMIRSEGPTQNKELLIKPEVGKLMVENTYQGSEKKLIKKDLYFIESANEDGNSGSWCRIAQFSYFGERISVDSGVKSEPKDDALATSISERDGWIKKERTEADDFNLYKIIKDLWGSFEVKSFWNPVESRGLLRGWLTEVAESKKLLESEKKRLLSFCKKVGGI